MKNIEGKVHVYCYIKKGKMSNISCGKDASHRLNYNR